jgi:hypothetical protein
VCDAVGISVQLINNRYCYSSLHHWSPFHYSIQRYPLFRRWMLVVSMLHRWPEAY